MKNIFIIFCLLIFSIKPQAQGIEFFDGTWEEVLAESKKQGKPIFVDAFTTWCGPCKAMAKNTFTKEEVGAFFNKNFISVKFDMEKKEGVKFGHKYPVKAYPTLYFINDKGDVLKKVVGGQKPAGLIDNAKKAMKADDRSGDYEEAYLAGNRDYDLVYGYVKALSDVGKPTLKISNDYLASNPEISEEQRLKFLFVSAVEADSKIFEEVLQNKEAIKPIVGNDVFMAKITSACTKTINKAIEYEFEDLMTDAIGKAKTVLPKNEFNDFAFKSKLDYYDSFNQDAMYFNTAKDYVKAAGKKNDEVLSFVASKVCAKLKEDEKAIKQAKKWAKQAYKIDDSQSNFNVYCQALISAMEYDAALDMIQKELDKKKTKYKKATLEQLKIYAEKLKQQEG